MSEQQTDTTAIDEHIAWLVEQYDDADHELKSLSKHPDDKAARDAAWGHRKAFREALEHARAAQERSGE